MTPARRAPFVLPTRADLRRLASQAFAKFTADNVPRLAAAFAFFALLSLAPLLVMAVVIAGQLLGEAQARGEVLRQARTAMGEEVTGFLDGLIANARQPSASIPATILSLLITFFNASNLFINLRETSQAIWRQSPLAGNPVKAFLVGRVFAGLGVLLFGALLLAWITLDSWLGYLARVTGTGGLLPVLSFTLTAVFFTLVFALAYRLLAQNVPEWSDVLLGALVAGVLFALAKSLLGLYFGLAHVSAAYGAAGGLVVVLLWLFYASQILFLGMEIAFVTTYSFGSKRNEDPSGLPRS